MEKIRKALDLAREQRAVHHHGQIPDPSPVGEQRRPQGGEVVAYEYTRTRVITPDPVALERRRIMLPSSTSAAAEAFRMLRTQILQRMAAHGWRSLAVVSPGGDEGRSTTAANLALTIAADSRHSALLCDLDLRSPSLAALFDFVAERGVDDVLAGRSLIEDCLYHPRGYDRFVLLPARAPLAGSSEVLAGPAARELVRELRERYLDRILIFDLPPVLAADDALAFAPSVECALVVVGEGTTRRDDLARCLELLRNTPIVGTVLNRAAGVRRSAL